MNFRLIAVILNAWDKLLPEGRKAVLNLIHPTDAQLNPQKALTDLERWAVEHGGKIAAIKSVRNRTGWGLKESKDFVESFNIQPLYKFVDANVMVDYGSDRW